MIVWVAVLSLLFHPFAAEAAHKAKKKKLSHHRTALAITPIDRQNPKYASIVIDATTGTILSSDNADALRHPASLTKMMTLLLVFDAVRAGHISYGQRITVSARANSMPPSKLGLRPGSTIRLDDAVAVLATHSANDIAVALAEAIGGSESAFAQRMTQRAVSIGMSRTRFYNASGLPNDYQVTTARDMARLARYMLTIYPQDSRVFARQTYSYGGRVYSNHNHLMETYAGMDCCKTGYINDSGFNLVASAKRSNTRLIGVVFGGRTAVTRNIHMASLLDEGFDDSKNVQYAMAKKSALAQVQPQTTPKNLVFASAPAGNPIRQSPPASEPALSITRLAPETVAAPVPAHSIAVPQPPLLQQQTPLSKETVIAAPAPSATINANSSAWAIQIGAYQTRLATDQAIEKAKQQLPGSLQKGQPMVVPLRTADATWMFRARLAGFTQSEANDACRYLKNCLTIAPAAY